jgi:hypothetical protein
MDLQTSQTVSNPATGISALLRDLIDYAGLFPPASLVMASSLAQYNAYLRSEWKWILGRFIVPVARLGEFEVALAGLPAATRGIGFTHWRLSVLVGSDAIADLAHIREFNSRMAASGGKAVIESVEVKATTAEEIVRLSGIIPAELLVYFEIPLSGCDESIAAVADCGRRAKIRTGGETPDKIPAPASVVEFIRLCAASNVPFKATAGLHHPLRSVHPLTYQSDSPSGMMHGFINLFLAAAFLQAGMDPTLARQVLEDQSAQAFHFDAGGVGWRQHRLSGNEITTARGGFAISFGSCSFMEPIDELRALHLL